MRLLTAIRTAIGDGWLLLGTDLVKDRATLVRAYDDSADVTAAFNRNVLHVVSHLLGVDFEPEHFTHEAYWDDDNRWVEMRLRVERNR